MGTSRTALGLRSFLVVVALADLACANRNTGYLPARRDRDEFPEEPEDPPIDDDPPFMPPPPPSDAGAPVYPDAGPPDAGIPLDFSYIMTFCERAFSCRSTFPGTAADFDREFGTSAAACFMGSTPTATERSIMQAAIGVGRIVYTPARVPTCVTILTNATCMTFWGQVLLGAPECEIYRGTVAAGGMCTTDAECATRLCNSRMAGEAGICGTSG